MAKKWDCVNCGHSFGFYDCVNVTIKGRLFVVCWDCFTELFALRLERKFMDQMQRGRKKGAHGHVVF